MVYNVYVSHVEDDSTVTPLPAKARRSKVGRVATLKSTPSPMNAPINQVTSKYRVRIFEVQAEK